MLFWTEHFLVEDYKYSDYDPLYAFLKDNPYATVEEVNEFVESRLQGDDSLYNITPWYLEDVYGMRYPALRDGSGVRDENSFEFIEREYEESLKERRFDLELEDWMLPEDDYGFYDDHAGYVSVSELFSNSKYRKFLELDFQGKTPSSRWGKKSELFDFPMNSFGTHGLKPEGNLVIFDLDVPKEDELDKFLSPYRAYLKMLSLGMPQGFTVSTPSGGLHVYVLWLDDNVPKQGRIEDYIVDVKGDIRSSASNGYVVAPYAVTKKGGYFPVNIQEYTWRVPYVVDGFREIFESKEGGREHVLDLTKNISKEFRVSLDSGKYDSFGEHVVTLQGDDGAKIIREHLTESSKRFFYSFIRSLNALHSEVASIAGYVYYSRKDSEAIRNIFDGKEGLPVGRYKGFSEKELSHVLAFCTSMSNRDPNVRDLYFRIFHRLFNPSSKVKQDKTGGLALYDFTIDSLNDLLQMMSLRVNDFWCENSFYSDWSGKTVIQSSRITEFIFDAFDRFSSYFITTSNRLTIGDLALVMPHESNFPRLENHFWPEDQMLRGYRTEDYFVFMNNPERNSARFELEDFSTKALAKHNNLEQSGVGGAANLADYLCHDNSWIPKVTVGTNFAREKGADFLKETSCPRGIRKHLEDGRCDCFISKDHRKKIDAQKNFGYREAKSFTRSEKFISELKKDFKNSASNHQSRMKVFSECYRHSGLECCGKSSITADFMVELWQDLGIDVDYKGGKQITMPEKELYDDYDRIMSKNSYKSGLRWANKNAHQELCAFGNRVATAGRKNFRYNSSSDMDETLGNVYDFERITPKEFNFRIDPYEKKFEQLDVETLARMVGHYDSKDDMMTSRTTFNVRSVDGKPFDRSQITGRLEKLSDSELQNLFDGEDEVELELDDGQKFIVSPSKINPKYRTHFARVLDYGRIFTYLDKYLATSKNGHTTDFMRAKTKNKSYQGMTKRRKMWIRALAEIMFSETVGPLMEGGQFSITTSHWWLANVVKTHPRWQQLRDELGEPDLELTEKMMKDFRRELCDAKILHLVKRQYKVGDICRGSRYAVEEMFINYDLSRLLRYAYIHNGEFAHSRALRVNPVKGVIETSPLHVGRHREVYLIPEAMRNHIMKTTPQWMLDRGVVTEFDKHCMSHGYLARMPNVLAKRMEKERQRLDFVAKNGGDSINSDSAVRQKFIEELKNRELEEISEKYQNISKFMPAKNGSKTVFNKTLPSTYSTQRNSVKRTAKNVEKEQKIYEIVGNIIANNHIREGFANNQEYFITKCKEHDIDTNLLYSKGVFIGQAPRFAGNENPNADIKGVVVHIPDVTLRHTKNEAASAANYYCVCPKHTDIDKTGMDDQFYSSEIPWSVQTEEFVKENLKEGESIAYNTMVELNKIDRTLHLGHSLDNIKDNEIVFGRIPSYKIKNVLHRKFALAEATKDQIVYSCLYRGKTNPPRDMFFVTEPEYYYTTESVLLEEEYNRLITEEPGNKTELEKTVNALIETILRSPQNQNYFSNRKHLEEKYDMVNLAVNPSDGVILHGKITKNSKKEKAGV